MYQCKLCEYSSSKKYNLARHENCHKPSELNLSSFLFNKELNQYECKNCYKSYKCKYSADKHNCQGLVSPLQCSKCKYIFDNPTQKSRHTCTTDLIPIYTTSEMIKYDTSHLNLKSIETAFRTFELNEGFDNAIDLLFQNRNNINVKKSSINTIYSKVYVGNGRWEVKADFEVYPRLVYVLSNLLLDILEKESKGRNKGIIAFLNDLITEQHPVFKRACMSFKFRVINF